MNSTQPRPKHPSYRNHRKQVIWQIVLPIVLAGLLFLGAIYLLIVGAFRGGGDVGRWAAISSIWLVLPIMLGALLVLVALTGITYLLGRLSGLIPPYTYQAQTFASKMAESARHVEELGHRPLHIVPEIMGLIRTAVRKVRRQRPT